jgi:hypothetical protein
LPQEHPDVLLVALLFQALEEVMNTDEASLATIEQLTPVRGLQLAPGLMGIGADGPGKIEENLAARFVARLGPRVYRAFGQAPLRIADDQRVMVFEDRAEAVTVGASASRIVEGEEGRRHRRRRHVAAAASRKFGESHPPG